MQQLLRIEPVISLFVVFFLRYAVQLLRKKNKEKEESEPECLTINHPAR